MIGLVKTSRERDGPAVRREILNTLRHEPGITKSQLRRRLNLSWGNVWHHVRRLQSDGAVVAKDLFGRTALYPAGMPRHEMLVLPLLRDEASLHILQILHARPELRAQDLTRRSALTRKQVRRRLDHLADAGLINRCPDQRGRFRLNATAVAALQRADEALGAGHWGDEGALDKP